MCWKYNTIQSRNSTSRYIPKRNENIPIAKPIHQLSYTAALFTTAKKWEQPKYSSIDEWVNKIGLHPYNGILFHNKKE